MENKKEFLKEFGELLNKHNVSHIKSIEYLDDGLEELAVIEYENGYKKHINISLDSILGAIKDIAKGV